ncbi:MAG: sulfatase-like hydrolase/transferase [Flavobacteriales bacterium]|nr:sulfatase-like hydrolase/transferase [Flavobacteriales bacterium]
MKFLFSLYNIPLRLLLQRLIFALFMLMICRMLFWIYNLASFPWPGFDQAIRTLFVGSYFDLISLFYALAPFILLHLIPGNWFYKKGVQTGIKYFFVSVLFLLMTLTCIDAGYFPFSKNRITIDLFKMAGNEEVSILRYILDYWWFIPFILVLTFIIRKFYPQTDKRAQPNIFILSLLNLAFLALLVFTIRGGTRLKPLRSIDTAVFIESPYASLAISSGFNFFESLQAENIIVPQYFDEAFMDKKMKEDYYVSGNITGSEVKKNVVILILESFGEEYVFPDLEGQPNHAPFLNELAKSSTVYRNAYSNGTRSVDAIPAILEGVPKLTNSDFMYSNYIKNKTPGFTHYLSQLGYGFHFFHGGGNGTMGFEAFLKYRDWNYYGKNEYKGPEEDYDGQWGIYDGPYLRYVSAELNNLSPPFVSAVFTLSSHHPYKLPLTHTDSFKKVKEPIHKTVRYTDACLRQFFEIAKKSDWYKNTIFILTGDHSGQNFTGRYQSAWGKYEVPILVFDPEKPYHKELDDVIQHIDIIPLVLEHLGYPKGIFTLGTYFKPQTQKLAFQNDGGLYQILNHSMIAQFNGDNTWAFREIKILSDEDSLRSAAYLKMELKVKIQDFYSRLLNNNLY